MGTRNLTCVYVDGEYKVAQYGQWDGYPNGQGTTALEFLLDANLDKFTEKVRNLKWITDEECERIDKVKDWTRKYPELSRDTGAEILEFIDQGVTKVGNALSFAGSSLFCEWAYVIDLDTNLFEIYQGFNKKRIEEGRFLSDDSALDTEGDYEPVRLLKTYNLDDLPTKNQFLLDLSLQEDDRDFPEEMFKKASEEYAEAQKTKVNA